MKPHILSTKVLAVELIEQLESAGISIEQHNFIQTHVSIPDFIDREHIQKYIVLTSKTAVHAWAAIAEKYDLDVANHLVFCIDQKTKETATEFQLPIVATAETAEQLADEILGNREAKAVTFICSNIRRDELPLKLKTSGVKVNEIVGYHTEQTPIKTTNNFDGVLFFSPSGVDSFLSLNEMKPRCFCIGRTTAKHAAEKNFDDVLVAEQSTPNAVIKNVVAFYSKK